ncbi:MAG: hypothetical protein GWO24_27115 [Akkermansiaceae bacterium]|nr:hypothetical protein [Akkermansiaceae bacterium]
METEEQSPGPNATWKIALVAVPLFLLLSSAWAMWTWWKRSQNTDPDPRLALAASDVQEAELEDHLHKLSRMIGVRDWGSPEGRQGMRRTIAFIEGTLSPQNYGFRVESGMPVPLGDELWPTIWVNLRGSGMEREVVVVAVPYDREDVQIAALLGAVNDLRDEERRKTVRFVFFPAELYARAGGKDVRQVLSEEESLVQAVLPRLTDTGGRLTAAEVVPLARDIVEKVRQLAR